MNRLASIDFTSKFREDKRKPRDNFQLKATRNQVRASTILHKQPSETFSEYLAR